MSYQHKAHEFAPIETKSADEPVDVAALVNDLRTSIEARLSTIETKAAEPADKLADRLSKIEAKLSRPAIQTKADDEKAIETKAFLSYLGAGQLGVAGMDPIEVKALSVGTATAGGYLAPEEFTTEFVRNLVQFSPIRSLADVRTTGHHAVLIPARTGITNAAWAGEAAASTGTQPTFGQLTIGIHNLTTHVDVNNQLLQDAKANVMAEVSLALAEDFGAKEGTAFVNGTGDANNQPTGFMTKAGVTEVLNGHAANLSSDALISILYSLAPAYRGRATWIMNGTTLATIRKLKDSQGNYLWQPGIAAGQPETILGRPVVEAIDMPDIAANAFPIAVGDFKSAYRIYDRLALDVMTNPYLLAGNQQTRVHAWRRVGGDVVQAAALRKLKMATS